MNNIFNDSVFLPEINIFESSYNKNRRHTFFTMKDEIIYSETENFGSKKTLCVKKTGENYSILYFTFFIELPENETFVDDIEFAIIKNIKLVIGGQDIHTLTNDQIYMHSKVNKFAGKNKNNLYITIPFYMNNKKENLTSGLALPFMSLYYHEVKIVFEYEKISNLVKNGIVKAKNPNLTFKCNVMIKQVFLTKDEEERFITGKIDYLVILNQNIYENINSKNYKLSLHEIKLNVTNFKFAFRSNTTDKYFNYLPICKNVNLYINDNLIFNSLGEFLQDENNIYTYSFELVNSTLQPSGSLNFSNINKSSLDFDLDLHEELTLVFSAEYFNILVIQHGMLALYFS